MSTARRSHRLPEPLETLVEKELGRAGGSRGGSPGITAIARSWEETVGETIARNAWPARFARDGTLVVNTSSSTWAFELTLLEPTIRAGLGESAPPRLSFVVGPVPEPSAGSVSTLCRSAAEPTADELSEGARIADSIEHDELRTAVARAASASLAKAREAEAAADASGTLQSG